MVNLVSTDFNRQGIDALNTGIGIGNTIQKTNQIGIDRARQEELDRQNQSLFGQKQQINSQTMQMNQQAIEQQEQAKGMGELVTALNLPFDERNELFAELEQTRTNPDSKKYLQFLQTLDDKEQLTSMIQLLNSRQGGKESKDTRTATQKEFEQYQQLKESDPNAAAEFGRSSGFLSDKTKRLFQVKRNDDGTTTKYYSDGSEDTVPATEKVKTDDMKSMMSADQAIKIVDKAKEGQLKNAGFALTLNDGLTQTKSMIDKGYDPTSASWVNKYLAGTTIGNLAMTEEDQVFVGAVEQMINAIARRETGAAITEFERKDFFNRYMPVAGDKPSRIKQKQKALERQFKSIRGQSGSVYDAIRLTQGMTNNDPVKTVNWADL